MTNLITGDMHPFPTFLQSQADTEVDVPVDRLYFGIVLERILAQLSPYT